MVSFVRVPETLVAARADVADRCRKRDKVKRRRKYLMAAVLIILTTEIIIIAQQLKMQYPNIMGHGIIYSKLLRLSMLETTAW
jgi:hypothetical protein